MSQIHFIDDSRKQAAKAEIRELRRDAKKHEEVQRQAALIRDQADLEILLEDSTPAMRTAMIDYLRPYLTFEPIDVPEPIADCPSCGLRRGSAIAHACVTQ